jgi:hypothetical protein
VKGTWAALVEKWFKRARTTPVNVARRMLDVGGAYFHVRSSLSIRLMHSYAQSPTHWQSFLDRLSDSSRFNFGSEIEKKGPM